MNNIEIQNLIKDLLEKTQVDGDVTVTECVLDEKLGGNCYAVELSNAHPFLSRDGEGLHALNHIVRRIVESKNNPEENESKEPAVMLDINGFQKKRIDTIRSLVHMMAERARYFKSSVELEPMSAYERRIVHEFLSDAEDLKTESDGFGRNRKVVIKYTGGI